MEWRKRRGQSQRLITVPWPLASAPNRLAYAAKETYKAGRHQSIKAALQIGAPNEAIRERRERWEEPGDVLQRHWLLPVSQVVGGDGALTAEPQV